jgi:hypothetical protein
LEDEDSDYEPNLFEAKDSDYEVDVSNRKPPPETIPVQENDRMSHVGNTVTDGMENIPSPHESVAVANFNTNDHHENFVSLSTISFVAIYYSPKIGGIGQCFHLSFNVVFFCLVSSIHSLFITLPCTKLTLITISRMNKATNFTLVNCNMFPRKENRLSHLLIMFPQGM